MSQTIKLKRNKTNAATTPSTLLEGEIAVNILDKSLFVGDGSNVVRLYVGSDKYFNSDGYANNALKLGGNEVSYFGTATQVTAINKSIESINNTKVTGIKMNNGLHMLPVNGVVDLGTILTEHQDLSGYQTKITSTNKLAYSLISGTPTTLAGYGITDALSTSGGTISGSSAYPLTIDTTNTNHSAILFCSNQDVKTQIGWNSSLGLGTFMTNYSSDCVLGIKDDGTPYYMNQSNWVYHTLYHTGNFNPADYLPLSGGTIEGGANALKIKRNGSYLSCIEFVNTDGSLGSLGFVWGNNPAFFHTDGNYYPLIHSGNIGSQSVASAGSANLLRIADIRDTNPNPNTLADVSLSAWFSNIWKPTGVTWNSGFTIRGWNTEYAVWQLASSANYEGNTQALYYRLGEGSTWYDWRRLLFNNDDNARFLNSSIVNGKYNTALTLQTNVASRANYQCGLAFNCLGAYSSTYENHTHAWVGLGPVVNTAAAEIYPLVFAVNGDTTAGTNPIERMRIMPNGNVLIGTTSDNGNKLQVNGTGEILNLINSSDGDAGIRFSRGNNTSWSIIDRIGNLYFIENASQSTRMILYENSQGGHIAISGNITSNGNISASGYKLPTSAPSNPASGGYYLYVGTLGAGATIS